MNVFSDITELRQLRKSWKTERVVLVPTMGALHEGHQQLIRHAQKIGDKVVVSIFVNPLQFGPHEDLNAYPRTQHADLRICSDLGVDMVFTPDNQTLYPEGLENLTTVVPPASMTKQLCGAYRPGHFAGVATVVLKLFNIIQPTMAIFGEKDAQQLSIIRKLVKDLNVPVEIIAYPTVRSAEGLALSSRNQNLKTPEAIAAAQTLFKLLSRIRELAQGSVEAPEAATILEQAASEILNGSAHHLKLQYLEVVDRQTLQPSPKLTPNTKVLVAAHVDNVRLIDNIDIV